MPNIVQPIYSWSEKSLFRGFSALLLLFVALAILFEEPLALMVPAVLLFILFAFLAPQKLFYLFFFLLPFSIEYDLPGGLATDLPSEQIMWVLFGFSLIYLIKSAGDDLSIFKNGITFIVFIHITWIAFTVLFSTDMVVSAKFLLAKLWYIFPFYFLPLLLFKSEIEFRKIFKYMLAGTLLALVYVMVRHAGHGFSFDSINTAIRPIFRNHVNYAVMLAALFPYFIYLLFGYKKRGIPAFVILLFFLLAVYLSFTRAAQISILLALPIFIIIKKGWARQFIAMALIGATVIMVYLSYNNKYLEYAPRYEKAIAHKKFDNLVEATYRMEDISTVERFYRWVAGFYMIKEKPLTGFGPTTFYENYKSYTVTSYKTYVSDNPEKSGIHNNYLMVAVEQGIPGLLIMLALAILPIIYGERAYHRLRKRSEKNLVMAAVITFLLIDIIVVVNDMLETDKVGPLYFLSAAIIVYFHHRSAGFEPKDDSLTHIRNE